jgi:hypothetical protein
MFKKILSSVVEAAVPAAIAIAMPGAMVNTAIGSAIKHKTRVNNQAIPLLNLIGSTGFSYARQLMSGVDPLAAIMPAVSEGGLLMAASTGLHQSIKVPMKVRTGRSL